MRRAEGNGVRTDPTLHAEPCGRHHLDVSGAVWHVPLQHSVDAGELRNRELGMQKRKSWIDLFERKEVSRAHGSHGFECTDWIAEVKQKGSAYDDIERSDELRVKLVDAYFDFLD